MTCSIFFKKGLTCLPVSGQKVAPRAGQDLRDMLVLTISLLITLGNSLLNVLISVDPILWCLTLFPKQCIKYLCIYPKTLDCATGTITLCYSTCVDLDVNDLSQGLKTSL